MKRSKVESSLLRTAFSPATEQKRHFTNDLAILIGLNT